MKPRISTARLLMACLAWLGPSLVFAQVGIVRTVEGQVSVFSGKQECAPRYGLDLEEGDAVRTGPNAWALLSMMDGAKITVRPDSEVRIDSYRYTDGGDAVLNRARLTLVQGALRVASGRIAAGGKADFLVQAPEASLALRDGDHDIAAVGPKFTVRGDAALGTYGRSYRGEAVMKNPHGEIALRTNQVGFVEPRPRAAPRVLNTEPYFYHWHGYIDRRAAVVAEKLDVLVP